MSHRPYARNPRAPYTGPRDIEAILPHTFRLEAPICTRDAKQEAIRRAIRRRCMQKNWRKMISIRHNRLAGEVVAEEGVNESKMEDVRQRGDSEEWQDASAAAKTQLEKLEIKLQNLTDQKHAKFQLLKEILGNEAKSKTTGNATAALATTATKKRGDHQEHITTS